MGDCLRVAFLACLAICTSVAAHAQDAVIGITVAGEAYKGPPKFSLLADGRVIGTKEVSSAVNTRKGKGLKFNKDGEASPSERALFKVPNIDKVSQLEVEFINDVWAGKGKKGDRNLYLLSLSVSTVRKTPTGTIVTIQEFLPNAFEPSDPTSGGVKIAKQYAALNRKGSLRLRRPDGGWGSAASSTSEPDNSPTVSEQTPAPAAPSKPCRLAPVELSGFEKNVSQLPQPMLEQLAALRKSLEGTTCTVRVTAHTAGGSPEFRASLSQARAQAIADELVRLGLPKDSVQIEKAAGRGRRVILTFK